MKRKGIFGNIVVMTSIVGVLMTGVALAIPIDKKETLGPYGSGHRYYIHVYNVDDIASAMVNGKFVAQVSYLKDSGWVDITGDLTNGINTIELTDENGPGEPAYRYWTYGFELRQDDSSIIWKDSCGVVGGPSKGCMNDDITTGLVYRDTITLVISPTLTPIPTSMPTQTNTQQQSASIQTSTSTGNARQNTAQAAQQSQQVTQSIDGNIPPQIPARQKVSISLTGEKTDVTLGEDIKLRLSAVNLINNPIMHVQVIILVPSGMSVTSSDFAKSGTNQFTAEYSLEPGDNKDVEVTIRPNQAGDFEVEGRIVYYFDDDKANTNDHTKILSITVRKSDPTPTPMQNILPAPAPTKSIPGFNTLGAILGVLFISQLSRKIIRRK